MDRSDGGLVISTLYYKVSDTSQPQPFNIPMIIRGY